VSVIFFRTNKKFLFTDYVKHLWRVNRKTIEQQDFIAFTLRATARMAQQICIGGFVGI